MSKESYHAFDSDEPVAANLCFSVFFICLLFCLLFTLTMYLDLQAQKGNISLPIWLSIGNLDDARIFLTAIISTVSMVLGLVFSVVLLVLSMAATQFGPRLLRRFIFKYNGQTSVGLFCGTFLFTLFTLIVTRAEPNGQALIPQITVLMTGVLMILSFASLIALSQNIRTGIQTGNLLFVVAKDLQKGIADYIAIRQKRAVENTRMPPPDNPSVVRERCLKEGAVILAREAGYLQSVNYKALIKVAVASNTVISLKVRPGNFIIAGTVLAHILPAQDDAFLSEGINDALYLGANRTLSQDPEFALAQIVEIGTRALSAAVNDPFTGIACIDWLSNMVLSLADLPETDESWEDEKGYTRFVEVPIRFPRLVGAAFDMIRQSGAKDPSILIRLLQNFVRIASHFKTEEQRDAIKRQVVAIGEQISFHGFAPTDVKEMMALHHKACSLLNPHQKVI